MSNLKKTVRVFYCSYYAVKNSIKSFREFYSMQFCNKLFMQFCLYVTQYFFDAISAPLSGVPLCMWHNEMPSDITPSVTGACLRFSYSAHRCEIILHIIFFFQQFLLS